VDHGQGLGFTEREPSEEPVSATPDRTHRTQRELMDRAPWKLAQMGEVHSPPAPNNGVAFAMTSSDGGVRSGNGNR